MSDAPHASASPRENVPTVCRRLAGWLRRLVAPGSVTWGVVLSIVLIGLAFLTFFWIRESEDRSAQIVYTYFVGLGTLAAIGVWWTIFSRLSWQTRIAGAAGAVAVAGAFFAVYRLEGFTGDFIPVLSPRWSTTAEERAIAYFGSQQSAANSPVPTSAEPLVVTADDWPQFRGPTRTGVVENVTIRRDWEAMPPKLLWKHPVGRGWSSFAVVGDFAFTQEQRGEEEVVVCYDVKSGEQVWVHADNVRFESTMGGDGPRATPTIADSKLYALGATGLLNCLEPRTGQVLWQRDIIADAGSSVAGFGMSTSPFVYDNVVVVNAGGGNDRGVIAYDRTNGEIVWAHGDRAAGYASPVLATFAGSRQLLIFGAHGLAGHNAHTGEELWWFPWRNETDNNCADPIVLDDGKIFLSTGYGQGTALLEVSREGDQWAARTVGWETSKRFKLKISGAVVKDGYVYGLDENILCCFDPDIGEQKWKRGRFGYGQLLLVDDVILISTDKGEVALVEANPERFQEIASFKAIEGKTWNHPVLCRGLLLVRNDEEAACYDLRPIE